ncbi:MAG TPA: RtcB family protein [Terriglobales bacterium]|jgi:tRNA-splicing ligase RtcB|nr:RtcB family protein [Terriglobales bacterium]
MVSEHNLVRVAEYVWEIPPTFREDMRVPARLYADEDLLHAALGDNSIVQLVNTATLPGVIKHAIAMPDIHQGYGFPIGGVLATRLPQGVISPGGVGYDINCGVRLLVSPAAVEEIKPFLQEIASALYANCPSGVGSHGPLHLSSSELDGVLHEGARWMLGKGYALREDLDRTEEFGRIPGADPTYVSARAHERGRNQLGTLGAGNHFIEVDRIAAVYDETIAARLGIYQGNVAVQIHCGSRGLGHQVCEDYVSRFQKTVRDYGITLPDRELVCAPFDSSEGQEYFRAMACAANFAFANRQLLAHLIRQSFEQVLAGRVENFHLQQVYDIAHNMAKVEEHAIEGHQIRVCVHRKGSTRAFGPGSSVLPDDLRDIGQPVLIPGSMGTASYVLVGTPGAMEETFGSTCHGAGRVMSRAKAKRMVHGAELRQQLKSRGILVCAGSMSGLAEEAPGAYKDVARVVDVVDRVGIGKKIARLEPIAVIKG